MMSLDKHVYNLTNLIEREISTIVNNALFTVILKFRQQSLH